MCDSQELNVSQWKVDCVTKYYNPEKDAGEGALQEAEEVAETPIRSPRSLKTMAAAMIHNDSGYGGLENSAGRKSPTQDGERIMANEKDENDKSTSASSSPILDAETVAEMFNRREECGDILARMVEMAAFLLVIVSVILSVFMGSGDETQMGGKRAAIKFYYDSLELQREGV